MSAIKPAYIPPHLQGRVSDFRQEADGNVSFFDPQNGKGMFGPEAARTIVEPDIFRTTFSNSRAGLQDMDKVYGLDRAPENFTTMAHDWIVDKGRKAIDYGTSSQGKSVAGAGLLGALGGGAAGFMGEKGSVGKGLLYALLASGAGAGLMAGGQHLNNHRADELRKSAYASSDLFSLVATNSHIPDAEKRQFTASFARLQDREKNELARLIRVTAGAAVGALIARYLRGKGLLTTLAGGMLGALVGRSMGPQQSYNAFGQLSTLNLR